jgi:hypothetical protein
MAEAVFSSSTWEDWQWNAEEALHLNQKLVNAPKFWRHLFLPQDKINVHLFRAHQELITAWHQWAALPQVKNSPLLRESENLSFLTLSAMGRIDQAKVRYESLVGQKKMLQVFSLRQHRFYQNLVAIYLDLESLLQLAGLMGQSIAPDNEDLTSWQSDIMWHAKELQRLVGPMSYKPQLPKRFSAPRIEINRLLGTVCLYQKKFLHTLFQLSI